MIGSVFEAAGGFTGGWVRLYYGSIKGGGGLSTERDGVCDGYRLKNYMAGLPRMWGGCGIGCNGGRDGSER
ncbi:MAG: hypothetical protein Kow0099_05320 [Candidatus Abyssubacteria bacterium]